MSPVSVVIAVYNGQDMVGQAISSVLHQTHPSIEVFVAVSYTHLDVYKRQHLITPAFLAELLGNFNRFFKQRQAF